MSVATLFIVVLTFLPRGHECRGSDETITVPPTTAYSSMVVPLSSLSNDKRFFKHTVLP